jgi:MinD superfamily P-loop ATPase
MILSIASGKGGTGKTTVALNLALSLENVQLLDCDVEEPNLHLFLPILEEERFPVCLPIPEVTEGICTYCGKCAQICRFNALAVIKNSILVFPELCHGCGGCSLLCPVGAITEGNREIGWIQRGRYQNLLFAQGTMNVGKPMPTPIIRKEKDLIVTERTVILDCPPGTSCPVIEGIRGSDFCLLVTENSPFGLNDLILAVEMVRVLDLPLGVFINRADLGDSRVRDYCRQENLPILGELPNDRRIAEIYSRGGILVHEIPGYQGFFFSLFEKIQDRVAVRNGNGLEKTL